MCQVIFSVLLIHVIFVTYQPDLSGHLKLTSFKPVTASAKAAPGDAYIRVYTSVHCKRMALEGGTLGQIEDLQGISNIPRNHG